MKDRFRISPSVSYADTSLIRGRQSGHKESLPRGVMPAKHCRRKRHEPESLFVQRKRCLSLWHYACQTLRRETALIKASPCKGSNANQSHKENTANQSLPLQGKQRKPKLQGKHCKLKSSVVRETPQTKASPCKESNANQSHPLQGKQHKPKPQGKHCKLKPPLARKATQTKASPYKGSNANQSHRESTTN